MRRYSKGRVVQQRGRWKGLWYEDGVKKSRIVGLCKDMTKTEAREAVEAIIAKLKPQADKPILANSLRTFIFLTIPASGSPARARTTNKGCGRISWVRSMIEREARPSGRSPDNFHGPGRPLPE